MVDHRRLAASPDGQSVLETCWMCGIRLPAERMVADGGSGCADIRWYCRDMRACTERWTTRLSGPAYSNGETSQPHPAT